MLSPPCRSYTHAHNNLRCQSIVQLHSQRGLVRTTRAIATVVPRSKPTPEPGTFSSGTPSRPAAGRLPPSATQQTSNELFTVILDCLKESSGRSADHILGTAAGQAAVELLLRLSQAPEVQGKQVWWLLLECGEWQPTTGLTGPARVIARVTGPGGMEAQYKDDIVLYKLNPDTGFPLTAASGPDPAPGAQAYPSLSNLLSYTNKVTHKQIKTAARVVTNGTSGESLLTWLTYVYGIAKQPRPRRRRQAARPPSTGRRGPAAAAIATTVVTGRAPAQATTLEQQQQQHAEQPVPATCQPSGTTSEMPSGSFGVSGSSSGHGNCGSTAPPAAGNSHFGGTESSCRRSNSFDGTLPHQEVASRWQTMQSDIAAVELQLASVAAEKQRLLQSMPPGPDVRVMLQQLQREILLLREEKKQIRETMNLLLKLQLQHK